jgi:uncharacterized membrane protein YeaQ/YmgE (transglycosylase-associated protein family)
MLHRVCLYSLIFLALTCVNMLLPLCLYVCLLATSTSSTSSICTLVLRWLRQHVLSTLLFSCYLACAGITLWYTWVGGYHSVRQIVYGVLGALVNHVLFAVLVSQRRTRQILALIVYSLVGLIAVQFSYWPLAWGEMVAISLGWSALINAPLVHPNQ